MMSQLKKKATELIKKILQKILKQKKIKKSTKKNKKIQNKIIHLKQKKSFMANKTAKNSYLHLFCNDVGALLDLSYKIKQRERRQEQPDHKKQDFFLVKLSIKSNKKKHLMKNDYFKK